MRPCFQSVDPVSSGGPGISRGHPHSLQVTSPAVEVLAHLLMRALGGRAIGESVTHPPVENRLPTPPSFLQTGECKGKLFSAHHSAVCTAGRESASGPLSRGKCCSGDRVMVCLPGTPFIFLNWPLSVLQPDLFFTPVFPKRTLHAQLNLTVLGPQS